MVGAAAVSILGQFAVDTPGGHFGRFDEMTGFGWLFASSVCAGTALAVWAHTSAKSWGGAASGLVLAASIGAFIPSLALDPVVGGAVVLWLLIALSRVVFPAPMTTVSSATGLAGGRQGPHDHWLETNRLAAQHLLLVSLVVTVCAVGFRVGDRLPALAVCASSGIVAMAWTTPYLRVLLATGSRLPWLLGIPLALAVASAPRAEVMLAWAGVLQAGMLAMLLARSRVAGDLIDAFFRRPALLVAASFAGLIAAGTLALSFPAASAPGSSISPIDALFTATSAGCVTGLVVVDTSSAFSHFGHIAILVLIQCGGLNIMVLSAFAALVLGNSLGLRGEQALGEVLDMPQARTAPQLAAFIVTATLAIESAGALLLAVPFAARGESALAALWKGAFHSVSAFCNAGFTLQPDNLVVFQRQPYVITVVAALIILGGLGFSLLGAAWAKVTRRPSPISVQLKVVVTASAILGLVGALWFGVAEWQRSLAGLTPHEKVFNAIFQSVTARTAGFNTVDLTLLHPATIVMFLVLMFIGASPGGTGGGIKTTTAAVLLGAIPAIARGESRVVLFGRTVPLETVHRSAAIAVIAALVAAAGTAALLATGALPFEHALFEVFSALGTVGLSLGTTAKLTATGKLVTVAVMFIGRIGPLSLALLLANAARGRVIYPDARIMVG